MAEPEPTSPGTGASALPMDHAAIITGLMDPDAYPHPVDEVTHLQTHISSILLTGDRAYKIKKPVDFGFLDF